MPAGRPTDYNEEITDIICERLASGESMRAISRDETMPAMSTLFLWLRTHEGFSEQYAKAKEESADALVEDMLDIADNQVSQPLVVNGKPVEIDGRLIETKDGPSVQHAKLRVDTRKWAASKLKPKKYGDRLETHHSGSIGLKDLTDAQLDARLDSIIEPISED
jgi:hypothetical protein